MTPISQSLEVKKDPRWNEAATLAARSSASHLNSKSNVLDNLRSNLDKLEELHSRLQFMMGEIKTLIRK